MTRKCHNLLIINSYTCTVYCVFSHSYVHGLWLYIYTEHHGKYRKTKSSRFYSNSILNYTSEILFSFCHFFHMIILSRFIGEMGFDTVRTRTLVISMWHGIISRLAENYNINCVIICFSFPESLRLCDYPIHFLCRINEIFYSLI